MKGKWWRYVLAFLLGAVVCGAFALWISHGAGAKLDADLSASRASLDNALASNRRLTESNAVLQEQHDRATADAAAERVQLSRRDAIAAGQQRIIDSQQRDLDAIKRGLDAIAGSFSGVFADLEERAKTIADGFAKLYAIYHQSPG